MSLARQHREAEGIALLRRSLALHPDGLGARRLLIRLLAVGSDLPAARDEVAALAARLPPGDPSPWIEVGHALELVHQFDEAMQVYQAASDAAPESPSGPREAGMRAAHWGEWEASRASLEEAVRRGAGDEETWHTLGIVRLNLHDLDGARDAYARGVAADPKAVDCWIGLATVGLAAHDWAGALAGLRRRRPAAPVLGRRRARASLGAREARASGRSRAGARPRRGAGGRARGARQAAGAPARRCGLR